MTKERQRRKKYIVLVRFQLRYIAYILLFLYIGAALAGYTVYWTTWVTLGEKLANVYPRGRLTYIFHAANLALLLRVAFITPFFILIGTVLSHRIAGPIFSISRYIDKLILGDYSRGLTLRKKDELKGIAKKISQLRDKLKNDRDSRNNTYQEILDDLGAAAVPEEVVAKVSTKFKNLNL